MATEKEILKTIEAINKRLDAIENSLDWMIRADQRFVIGTRVKFSEKADRQGISAQRKGGVKTGIVVGLDGFSVKVLLDGYKKPQSFHHSFFEENWRPRRKK